MVHTVREIPGRDHFFGYRIERIKGHGQRSTAEGKSREVPLPFQGLMGEVPEGIALPTHEGA